MTNSIRTSQIIIDEIIQMIKTQQLEAGSKLPSERMLAKRFNISRTSVREAFSVLKNLGIIQIRQGGGAYVSDFTIDPLFDALAPILFDVKDFSRDIQEFRIILEVNAAGLAAQTRDCSKLRLIVKQMQEAVKETSPAATELDMAFHQEIGYLSGNVLLIQAMACVAYLLKHSIKANRQELLTDAGDKALFQQHQAIYEAIAAHDSQQAMTLMNEHLNFKKKKEKLAI